MAKKKTNSSPKATAQKGTKPKVDGKPKELVVKLVSYTVRATIPTMSYGNIMPEITVQARTMEEAKLAVMPHIEELYRVYAEAPRDGSKGPAFLQKASVTATERVVPQTPTAPKTDLDKLADDLKTSPAYDKALSAIKNSMSKDALGLIEDQIQKSTRLSPEEKPQLLAEVLKKRKEFN